MLNKNQKLKDNKSIFLISAIVLLSFFVCWTYLSYIPKKIESSALEKSDAYAFLNPARKLIDKGDLIINFQPLRDYLNDKYESDAQISIYFEFLNTGANISINKDAEFFPASLLKLPVAMAVAKKVEKGQWKWSNELVLMRNDKDELFGTLYKEEIGTPFTIEKLVEKMLVESDNTAYHILLRNIEPEELNDIHSHLGLEQFFSNEGKISAKRYSIIFRSLYNSSYLSEDNSQKILSLLIKTSFGQYLGSGLPDDIKFSHKIGVSDEQSVFMDSGIIYNKNRPYLLTTMIQTDNKDDAQQKMKDISEKVYDHVANYKEE